MKGETTTTRPDFSVDRPSGKLRDDVRARFQNEPATDRKEVWIARDDIAPDPLNPGGEGARFSDESLDTLMRDIEANGQDEAVTVGPVRADGKYPLVTGHRRLAAILRSSTVSQLRAQVREDLTGPAGILAYQIRENESRENVSAIASARSIERLLALTGPDTKETRSRVCEMTGKSDPALRQLLTLARAQSEVQRFAEESRIQDVTALYKLSVLFDRSPDEATAFMQEARDTNDYSRARARIEARLNPSESPHDDKPKDNAKAAAAPKSLVGGRGKPKVAKRAWVVPGASGPTLYVEVDAGTFRASLTADVVAELLKSLSATT